MEREPDYYELPYDDFVEALEKKVVEQRTKGFGLPEDYASALELADVSPDWPGVYVSLAEATELIPEETLQNELYRAMGEAAAVHMVATVIDSRKARVNAAEFAGTTPKTWLK
jgi:hypothetical protein